MALKSLVGDKYFRLYYYSLALLAIGLVFGNFLMSISLIFLLTFWLLDGNLKTKLKAFVKNKAAVAASSIYLLHLIGLIYTVDFEYGLEDVRKKIPLLLLPLIISTSPSIPFIKLKKLLSIFLMAVTAGCFISVFLILTEQINDIRNASLFISHIRFSLLICFAIFISAGFLSYKPDVKLHLTLYLLIAFFLVTLILMESLTGLSILLVTTLILLFSFVISKKSFILKISSIIIFCLLIAFSYLLLRSVAREYRGSKSNSLSEKLYSRTSANNIYMHDTINKAVENGFYVWRNVSETELEQEWNKRSEIKYNEADKKKNEIKFTLIRFLTSKGELKDGEAVKRLTEKEVQSIEKGIANYKFQGVTSIRGRIYKILWELDNYKNGGNPSGHSLTQRFEFWKTAVLIIKDNLITGVGTGDAKIAFAKKYTETNSALQKDKQLRSHNQFLAIMVAFGVLGLLWFLYSLLYPVVKQHKLADYYFMCFFCIAIFSFFAEDTLETQAGVTFFAFFNSLFLFGLNKSPEQEESSPRY